MRLPESIVFASVDPTVTQLMNQDRHGGNILSAEREAWLVIDPKPLVGEPELNGVGLSRNAAWRGSACRCLEMLTGLGLDRERLRAWGVAHAIAWGFDEYGWSRRCWKPPAGSSRPEVQPAAARRDSSDVPPPAASRISSSRSQESRLVSSTTLKCESSSMSRW
jgi:hypothetical protein